MARTLILLAAIGIASTMAFAEVEIHNTGQWPQSWPHELEPLRKQSRTMTGGKALLSTHEIRFSDREQFEAAWPHLLKVKAEGAPIVLKQEPSTKCKYQVRVQSPPTNEEPESPAKPIVNAQDTRARWINTQYLELCVDGEIVDLNRIRIPTDTPIIDERFKDSRTKTSSERDN